MSPPRQRALLALALCTAYACEGEGIWHMPRASLERMQAQLSYRPYARNDAFADGRAMRPPPATSAPWQAEAAPAPVALERSDLEEARTLFDTFCAVCHGLLGEGDTVVAEHMRQVKPTRLSSERVRAQSDAQLQRVIESGYGLMAGFSDRLTPAQARSIVVYMRALDLSQDVGIDALPAPLRARLKRLPANPTLGAPP